MKKTILWCSWVFFYAICAGLGYITDPADSQKPALLILALLFFVPGAILLIDALRAKDQKTLLRLRWISGLSLALTLVLLVANVMSALSSEAVGNVLYELLIFVSVPMICSQQWLLSLFLWACLLFATLLGRKKK